MPTPLKSSTARLTRWVQHRAYPALTRAGERIVTRIHRRQGESQAMLLQPSRQWSSWIIWTLVSVTGFAILWACLARIDETVQATGKLEPKAATKDIRAPLGGVVKDILVKDGDRVAAGQVLLEMDPAAARAKMDALRLVQSRVTADLQLSRGQLGQAVDPRRLSANQLSKLRALRDEYASRIDAARQGVVQARAALSEVRINLLAKSQALQIREAMLRGIAPLAREGALARTQYQKELQEVVLLRGEVASLRSNQARARASLAEAQQRMANTEALTRIDFSTKVEESEKQLAELSNQITETGLTLKYQKIVSPVKGIVFDLKAGTPGYVVNTEAPIVKIVPTDRLVARIFLTNKDIGFVRPGQTVKVRIDAFPYNEFGEISGRVASIGSDVLPPDETYNYFRFPVTVDLDRNYLLYKGRKLELGSGMSLSANVILRQRPVISIFTQQILPFWDTLEKL